MSIGLIRYRATHRSVVDGSEAMLLRMVGGAVLGTTVIPSTTMLLCNENGDEWTDDQCLWEAL